MTTFKQYLTKQIDFGDFPVLFHDENENAIVHEDGDHRISVNKPGNASYVVLWHKPSPDGNWKKSGEFSTCEKTKKIDGSMRNYLSVNHIEINKEHRGNGFGTKMYKVLLAHAGNHIHGIISHIPDRVNKIQVPSIYKGLGAKEHNDFQVIEKYN